MRGLLCREPCHDCSQGDPFWSWQAPAATVAVLSERGRTARKGLAGTPRKPRRIDRLDRPSRAGPGQPCTGIACDPAAMNPDCKEAEDPPHQPAPPQRRGAERGDLEEKGPRGGGGRLSGPGGKSV